MSQSPMDYEQQQQPQLQHHHAHHHQDSFEDHTSGQSTADAYDPQHQSPAQDYNGFSNYAPLATEPVCTQLMHPPPPLSPQSLIFAQQPSTFVPLFFSSAPVPIASASATPVSAKSTITPCKLVTDADRRRICQYHEDHPTVKQKEIGAIFGVSRSTVSKVLRQKERYLYQVDGSQSPIKTPKRKPPAIEPALSIWARNHQRQGLPLSDAIIRDKARFFAQTVGNSESHLKTNSSNWLEKFKQKNNLMGEKSRKRSIVEESEGTSSPPSNVHTPTGSVDSADCAYLSDRPPSRASSYGSVGSVDSGLSHPPRAKIKRKMVVDMSYTEFAKQASEEPTLATHTLSSPQASRERRARQEAWYNRWRRRSSTRDTQSQYVAAEQNRMLSADDGTL